MIYLGIDTSNYTTSAAIYDPEKNSVEQLKKLLPVKKGDKGLRQSDAVFYHTQQLPDILQGLLLSDREKICSVGVSSRPRAVAGSYMPCFTVGMCSAKSISSALKCKYYEFSHQQGHIIAALFSANRLDLIDGPFIAFHVSGGTTEALYVTPDSNEIIHCEKIISSSDLKAGQAIDRVGLMLELDFPCGRALDALSLKSNKKFKIHPSVKDGNPSFSGLENKCEKMLQDGANKEDIALYCIEYVLASLEKMLEYLINKFGAVPIVFSGGVSSNTLINRYFSKKYSAIFAESKFSSDNAAGIAILAYLKEKQSDTDFNS